MTEKNLLTEWNAELNKRIVATKKDVDARRAAAKPLEWREYLLSTLTEKIAAAIGYKPEDLDLSFVDSSKFKADVAIRVTPLLKSKPTPLYIKEEVPRFVVALEALKKEKIIDAVEGKGIYVNVTLNDEFLLSGAEQILEKGELFGTSNLFASRRFVVDYSSPNVAKHLHAGHIRSTIIGHVLCNLYEAAGGTAYRFNYLNDWGGFGELIEGYDRWVSIAPKGVAGNDLLFFIYSTFRTFEKGAASEKAFFELSSEERVLVEKCFAGQSQNYGGFKEAFEEFRSAARARFTNLESGKKAEMGAWENMVKWSLEDFERFYSLLNIHEDFVVGESFFVEPGRKIVTDGLAAGTVLKFTGEHVAAALSRVRADLEAKKISENEAKTFEEEIARDTGAYVVLLDNNRRMVVQRADGTTIYATRDLAGLKYRTEVFQGTDFVYEVGQEQSDHFTQLFEAGAKLGLMGTKPARCLHIYHGFYVDSTNKKKLSSRQGASSVLALFEAAIQYFFEKYEGTSEFSAEERRDIAHKLAIGSVVYNDLRRDKKLPVELNPDRRKMVEEFEKAGGAYVVYSVCRAKSILRKANVPSPRGAALKQAKLVPVERELLKLLLDFPRRVVNAARNDNPAALITYLEETAVLYNRYYNEYPVIKGGEQNFQSLTITQATAQAIENGLRICHVTCPDRI